MGEIKFTNGIVMTTVFITCILIFVAAFQTDNNSEVTMSSDLQNINTTSQAELVTFRTAVNNVSSAFQEDNVQTGSDVATSGGQFKVTQGSTIGALNATVFPSFKKIFGPEFYWVLTTFVVTMSLIFIRLAYKTWFGRDPE